MPNAVFVSYRRLDSQHAAFAIADRLRWAFGKESVFFDRGSIEAGNEWPKSLELGLQEARVLLVVMGKNWLATYDDWGRRRIDDARDWVRREVHTGLLLRGQGKVVVIPVLLEGASRLRREALDDVLQDLADIEPLSLRDDHWEDDLEALIEAIAGKTGMYRHEHGDRNPNGSPARPRRDQASQQALPDPQVRTLLEPLSRWHLQWRSHPWGIGGQAQEIAKDYDFPTFAEAIAFMAYAAKAIDVWTPPHHPRWENQWKVVSVAFSTWDVDCRVTKLDIKAAQDLDDLHTAWCRRPKEPARVN